jgi:hypothetical protein
MQTLSRHSSKSDLIAKLKTLSINIFPRSLLSRNPLADGETS